MKRLRASASEGKLSILTSFAPATGEMIATMVAAFPGFFSYVALQDSVSFAGSLANS